MNCDGDAVIDMDMDASLLVEDMLIFPDAELEGVCMVRFIMLVVDAPVSVCAVYATEALLMDDIMLPGMPPVILPGVLSGTLLMSGIEAVAAGFMDDEPAAPQRVLANARAADNHSVTPSRSGLVSGLLLTCLILGGTRLQNGGSQRVDNASLGTEAGDVGDCTSRLLDRCQPGVLLVSSSSARLLREQDC